MKASLKIALGRHGETPYRPLSEVAPLVRREIAIDPVASYTELGVRSFHKGTFHRRTLQGAEFTWQGLYRINANDLVFSNIMAWEGAVGLAQPEDDGCIGNHRMLTCACDPTVANPAFLAHYFKTPEGMAQLVGASTGTVARNRTLTAASLAKIQVPVPPLNVQGLLVRHFVSLKEMTQKISERIEVVEQEAAALLLSLHDQLSGPHSHRLGDVLELFEESVSIQPSASYPQVGVRGFGGGLFPKAAVAGTNTSYSAFNRLYADALVLSQVKGWEGALALCPPELDGMFVSPEYRTFRCIPEMACPAYIGELVKTPWFWGLLQEATRGVGARRERTRPEQFLNIKLPMPTVGNQRKAAEILTRQTMLKAHHAAIREANAALIPATLERVFAQLH